MKPRVRITDFYPNFGLSSLQYGPGKKAMGCSQHLFEKNNHGQHIATIVCYYSMSYIWEMRLNSVSKLMG